MRPLTLPVTVVSAVRTDYFFKSVFLLYLTEFLKQYSLVLTIFLGMFWSYMLLFKHFNMYEDGLLICTELVEVNVAFKFFFFFNFHLFIR